MGNKLVSVIIPSYGGGQLLARAVDSVLEQTYTNIEVIVVDDNGQGTENQKRTEDVMKRYSGDKRVRYVCHEVNKNGSAARNTGFRNSSGEYIALLDDDDEFINDKIRIQLEALEALPEDYALTFCSTELYQNNVKVGEWRVSGDGRLLYEVLRHTVVISSSAILIRRSVWEAFDGFDESFRRHQDWEFTARIAADYSVKAIDIIGVRRYIEKRNSAKNIEQAKAYLEHYLEKMKPLIDTLTEEQQRQVYLTNRMDVAFMWVKQGDVLRYLRECRKMNAGIKPFIMMARRGKKYLKKNGTLFIRKRKF